MIFITSDLHFEHSNIIRYSNRPFADVNEMNNALIENWNKVVSPRDTVLCLGDFMMSEKSPRYFTQQLNGHIHLIKGNHDKFDTSCFASVRSMWRYKYHGLSIFLIHYPMLSWPGDIHLFGHVHSGPHKPLAGQMNSYDVGIDNNNYTPISIDQAIEKARQDTRILSMQILE